jgi:cell division protein FtsB
MVIRRRIRAVIFPLLLYCVSGSIGGYFVWHASNGERGLKTKEEYEHKIALLQTELGHLHADRVQWEHKIELLRGQAIDRDLLDEEARHLLGEAHKSDLVIFVTAPQK